MIKLKEFKKLIWNANLLNYRLFNLCDGIVNVDFLPLLWEIKKSWDWIHIGGTKYYVQELQTNIPNTLDILISRNPDAMGDSKSNK